MDIHYIQVPQNLSSVQFSRILPALFNKYADNLPLRVKLDFSKLKFVSPGGVVLLDNLIAWLRNRHVEVNYTIGGTLSEGVGFLDDSDFFKLNFDSSLRLNAKLRSTSFRISRINQANNFWFLQNDLLPWMRKTTGLSEASLYPIKTCMLELFNNTIDHASSEIGCMFAQHFPLKKELVFAFADAGIGIPTKVRTVLREIDGPEAIITAVSTEGFTTKSTPRNQGIGLKLLMDTIVSSNLQGSVNICSNNAIVHFLHKNGTAAPHIIQRGGYSPGTCFEIKIPIDNIDWAGDEDEEFTW